MASIPPQFHRSVHLLYSPTLCCNLGCSYCYLGRQTGDADFAADVARAVPTLRHALTAFTSAGVLPFNVSLHGGEVTTLPATVLSELLNIIQGHYLQYYDDISALGHNKSAPHLKTNLYRFDTLYDLLLDHRVSVSASIDLPLALHARFRTTRGGQSWLNKTLDNLRLLGRYPHAKKISTTFCADHLQDLDEVIRDIWFIHRDLGFDMTNFNIMFAFPSALNTAATGGRAVAAATPEQQIQLYRALTDAFAGTELEYGLRRHWFDEFKPSYCTNALNCGQKFFLLQSDGSVYPCVRGQGLDDFHYGNIFEDDIETILATGARKICHAHQVTGFDDRCRHCEHLDLCHTGCPVVKAQMTTSRSYTCDLQRVLYRDQPRSYPPVLSEVAQRQVVRDYLLVIHPGLAVEEQQTAADRGSPPSALILPADLDQARNRLRNLIAADPVLKVLYAEDAFVLGIGEQRIPLASQLLKSSRIWHTIAATDSLTLWVRKSVFAANCSEPVRNALYLQMLRDTPVIYGDEQRTKQEHVFTWLLFHNQIMACSPPDDEFAAVDLTEILAAHRHHYRPNVLNNLFVTTQFLRDYHYQKHAANAFYHIQAINLPFQNLEFFYLDNQRRVE